MRLTFDYLDDKEIQMIELTTFGLSAKEIGQRMGLSESRVSNVKSRILRSLGYRSSAQLTWEDDTSSVLTDGATVTCGIKVLCSGMYSK